MRPGTLGICVNINTMWYSTHCDLPRGNRISTSRLSLPWNNNGILRGDAMKVNIW
jgi:hypothetical protein